MKLFKTLMTAAVMTATAIAPSFAQAGVGTGGGDHAMIGRFAGKGDLGRRAQA